MPPLCQLLGAQAQFYWRISKKAYPWEGDGHVPPVPHPLVTAWAVRSAWFKGEGQNKKGTNMYNGLNVHSSGPWTGPGGQSQVRVCIASFKAVTTGRTGLPNNVGSLSMWRQHRSRAVSASRTNPYLCHSSRALTWRRWRHRGSSTRMASRRFRHRSFSLLALPLHHGRRNSLHPSSRSSPQIRLSPQFAICEAITHLYYSLHVWTCWFAAFVRVLILMNVWKRF